jgi:hypothetical protein
MSQPRTPHDREPSDPTPQQIQERSAEVRRRWSKRVAARRVVQTLSPWLPPLVYTTELVREMNNTKSE